jgi:hypothetical protein
LHRADEKQTPSSQMHPAAQLLSPEQTFVTQRAQALFWQTYRGGQSASAEQPGPEELVKLALVEVQIMFWHWSPGPHSEPSVQSAPSKPPQTPPQM